MNSKRIMSLITALITVSALSIISCGDSDDDDNKDMQQPVISNKDIIENPIDCQVYHRGETILFHYIMTDNQELGAYNIEIHNNFDHHTHSTTSVDCEMDAKKTPQHPWVYNQNYAIPSGLRSYEAKFDIPIPADIDTGDYHFMIRLTDKAGWQQIHSVAIKIAE